MLVDRGDKPDPVVKPVADKSDAIACEAHLERDVSIGTPLEQNCTGTSDFDANLSCPSHDVSDASKKASTVVRACFEHVLSMPFMLTGAMSVSFVLCLRAFSG